MNMLQHDNVRIEKLQGDVSKLSDGLLSITTAIKDMKDEMTIAFQNQIKSAVNGMKGEIANVVKNAISTELNKMSREIKTGMQNQSKVIEDNFKQASMKYLTTLILLYDIENKVLLTPFLTVSS